VKQRCDSAAALGHPVARSVPYFVMFKPCLLVLSPFGPPQVGVRTNEEREQTLNQLLSEMDGFTPDSGGHFSSACVDRL